MNFSINSKASTMQIKYKCSACIPQPNKKRFWKYPYYISRKRIKWSINKSKYLILINQILFESSQSCHYLPNISFILASIFLDLYVVTAIWEFYRIVQVDYLTSGIYSLETPIHTKFILNFYLQMKISCWFGWNLLRNIWFDIIVFKYCITFLIL